MWYDTCTVCGDVHNRRYRQFSNRLALVATFLYAQP